MYYEIHGISDCPACLRAQALLMQKDLEYVFINADFSKKYRRKTIREELFWTTFPIVVLVTEQKSVVIGGYDQLIEHLKR